jgi:ferrous iron transport protein A
MHLDAAHTGQALTVLGPARPALASGAVARRLAELGIRPGATLRVLSRTSGGGAIIAIGDDRIAVSRQILAAIEVGAEVPSHG